MRAYGVEAAPSHSLISNYLRTHAVRKLQIGAGGSKGFDDWLNTDIEPHEGEADLDATKPSPIPDGAPSYIFPEQGFEHLSYRDGLAMPRECHRTLKRGGKIRFYDAQPLEASAIVPGWQDRRNEDLSRGDAERGLLAGATAGNNFARGRDSQL